MHPGEAFAILEGETLVGAIVRDAPVGIDRCIGTVDLHILGLKRGSGTRHRKRQQGQRIGLREQGACRRSVSESIGAVASHDLVGAHLWALVAGIGVGHQDVGLGGVVRATVTAGRLSAAAIGIDVQILAQGIGAARADQGVFLVGIVARLGVIVLHINRARSLRAEQITTADPLSDHDL